MNLRSGVFGASVVLCLALAGCSDDTGPDRSPATPTPTRSAATPTPSPTVLTSNHGVQVVLSSPVSGAVVSSPLELRGQVTGSWMFEASFGVKLLDANRHVIAHGPATAVGDWMTTDPVLFKATLTFAAPASDTGILVLENANASGDPATADSVEIPVRFR